MYEVNFKVKCTPQVGGWSLYSIPCASLDIALSMAAFLSKVSHEPGVKICYEDISVEPSISDIHETQKK